MWGTEVCGVEVWGLQVSCVGQSRVCEVGDCGPWSPKEPLPRQPIFFPALALGLSPPRLLFPLLCLPIPHFPPVGSPAVSHPRPTSHSHAPHLLGHRKAQLSLLGQAMRRALALRPCTLGPVLSCIRLAGRVEQLYCRAMIP